MNTNPDIALKAAEAELRAGNWQAAREIAIPWAEDRNHGLRARAVLANTAMQTGDYQEAVKQFRVLDRNLPARPDLKAALSMALNNLGSQALQDGDAEDAEAQYREALEFNAANALAWFNLAFCQQRRRDFIDAAESYAHCAGIDSSLHDARINWATCERMRGSPDSARNVLAGFGEEFSSLNAETAAKAGMEWDLLGDAEKANQAYERVMLDHDPQLLLKIAGSKLGTGDVIAAREFCLWAGQSAANDAIRLRAALPSELGLPSVPGSREEIEQSRVAFSAGLKKLSNEWPADRFRHSGLSLDDLAHSHFLLAYQGHDDLALSREFGKWYCSAAAAIHDAQGHSAIRPSCERTVVLVSARWNLGTINAYFGSWIEALSKCGWDTHVVHLGSSPDKQSRAVASNAARFWHVPGSLDEVSVLLRDINPVAIVYPEVGLDPRVQLLAALRLAPLQVAAWGHPVSTGLETVDYYFSCAEMEPENASGHYSESLALLPGIGTHYSQPKRAETISRSELGLPGQGNTYVVPHAAVKMHPGFDELLVGIARADSRAKFILFEDSVFALTMRLRERLEKRFDQHGLDPTRYLNWLPRASPGHFRSVLKVSDVMLDSPGFSGGNTSLDAIAQGLPMIAIPGEFMRSRQSAAMLKLCGAQELIAENRSDYIEKSVQLATCTDIRTQWRRHLLENGPVLFGDTQPLTVMVEALERAVEDKIG